MTQSNAFDLIVVGGGTAGFAAAHTADRHAARTLLVDDGAVGFAGSCVNVACVPTKHLLNAAELIYAVRIHRHKGIRSSVAIDFREVLTSTLELIAAQRQRARTLLGTMKNVSFVSGTARFLSHNELDVAGSVYRSDRFIIATGSSPFIPAIPGLATLPYLTNAEALHLSAVPRSLVVIGGGSVGVEFALLYSRLGAHVYLLQRGDRILRHDEPELTNLLTEYMRAEGIEVHPNADVTQASAHDGDIAVTASIDGKERIFSADHVLVATGRRPNSAELGLENVGVLTGDEGEVIVDDEMKAAAHVWAAGDVTGEPMLEPVAAKQGWIAASNALSERGAIRMSYAVIPRAVFTDPQLASVGLTEQQAILRKLRYRCTTIPLTRVAKTRITNDSRGAIKMIVENETNRIIGVHVLAPNAADLIHEAAMIVKKSMVVQEVVDTLHVFPTFSEVIKQAAHSLLES